jgi:hypothetical protein
MSVFPAHKTVYNVVPHQFVYNVPKASNLTWQTPTAATQTNSTTPPLKNANVVPDL